MSRPSDLYEAELDEDVAVLRSSDPVEVGGGAADLTAVRKRWLAGLVVEFDLCRV